MIQNPPKCPRYPRSFGEPPPKSGSLRPPSAAGPRVPSGGKRKGGQRLSMHTRVHEACERHLNGRALRHRSCNKLDLGGGKGIVHPPPLRAAPLWDAAHLSLEADCIWGRTRGLRAITCLCPRGRWGEENHPRPPLGCVNLNWTSNMDGYQR